MLRRFANGVQGLMTRSRAGTRGDDSDPAAVGFVERLRDEWNDRNDRVVRPDRFGLPQLLAARAAGGAAIVDTPAFLRDERTDALPTERLDVDGCPQPLDEAFFGRDRYRLPELTGFADAVFVEVAFRCVLKRRPDPPGFANFLRGLRSGALDRIDVLRGLSASIEGRRVDVTIDGLARVAFWRRVGRAPIVGPLVRWLLALVRLPRIAQEQRAFQAQTLAWQHRRERHDETTRIELERLQMAIAALGAADDGLGDAIVDLANRVQCTRAESSLEGTSAARDGSTLARDDRADAVRRRDDPRRPHPDASVVVARPVRERSA